MKAQFLCELFIFNKVTNVMTVCGYSFTALATVDKNCLWLMTGKLPALTMYY